MLTLFAESILQRFGDLFVGGIVLAMVAFGVQHGLFLAVLAVMQALVSIVVALAFAEPLAAVLATFELPEIYTFPLAFGLLLVGTAVGTRLAVGGYVPADVVRFEPPIDKLGGGLMGAVAGVVIAGTFLIANSIVPVPEAFRIDGAEVRYDMGSRMLKTFARCVEPDDARRAVLLDGEPSAVPAPPPEPPAPPPTPMSHINAQLAKESEEGAPGKAGKHGKKTKIEIPPPPPPPAPPPPPRWSEPFADWNDNKQHDEGEPFLDTDNDQAFTARLVFDDANGNRVRDIGLLERYRLHAWGRRVISVVTLDEVTGAESAPGSAPTAGSPGINASVPGKAAP